MDGTFKDTLKIYIKALDYGAFILKTTRDFIKGVGIDKIEDLFFF